MSSSRKTGDSGESGVEEGKVVEEWETMLPLLLAPVRRISQWSDTEELVDPWKHNESRQTMRTPDKHYRLGNNDDMMTHRFI